MTDKSMRHFDYEVGKDIFKSEQDKIHQSNMQYQKTFEDVPIDFAHDDSSHEHEHETAIELIKSSEYI